MIEGREPVARKVYYSIGEVALLVGVETHTLRYWEEQFRQLRPLRRSGNRTYRKKDIDLVEHIKHLLYEEKYTIAGARRQLDMEGG